MCVSRFEAPGRWRVAAVSLATLVPLQPAMSQDIEMAAQVTGRALPVQYYQRVSTQPDFFTFRHSWLARADHAAARGEAVIGTLPMVVILALHADSPEPTTAPGDIQGILFDGPSATGTLSDYFTEVSRGRFDVSGQVVPWVRTSLTVAEVRGNSFGLGSDARTGEFLVQALTLADATIDFREFDNDGPDLMPNSGDDDGYVDALALEFLESSITCAGAGPTIWAHRAAVTSWRKEPYTTNDIGANGTPIIADDYIVQAAERCDGRQQRITTIAHEMGHMIGLPDLYDQAEGVQPAQRNWVVGCWSGMAAGQWGCGPALANGTWDRLPHYGPWEKIELGWLPNVRVVGAVRNQEYVLAPVESGGEVLRVSVTPTEYFLVEYRSGSGFDTRLPANGVLIYHVDLDRPQQRCRSCLQLYNVALVEADGNRGLIRREGEGGNRGEAGDVFAASGGPARLTNATTPSTRLNSGAESSVTFYSITVADGEARIRLSTSAVALDQLLQPFLGGQAPPLSTEDRAYLDTVGNGNGRFDVGDLRSYLAEHPVVAAGSGGTP